MDDARLIEEWGAALRQGTPVCVVTVAAASGSTPRKAGAKMLVFGDGRTAGTIGGGLVERAMTEAALDALQRRAARLEVFQLNATPADARGMICGGAMTFLLEPCGAGRHLHIFGAGHCGLALARAAAPAGFLVHVYDDRPELVTRARYPMAASLHTGSYDEMTRAFAPAPDAYAAIMTHAHAHDALVLANIINTDCVYLGMMASKKKKAETWAALTARGISAEALERVHSPIGVAIGAQTPEEIAVSILAELIAVARRVEQPA